MDETVTNKANELLLQMISDAQGVRDFVVEQAPDVVQQLLAWHFFGSLLYLFMTIIVIGMTTWGLRCPDLRESAAPTARGLIGVFSAMAGLVIITGGLVDGHLFNWLKITIAPKLYLLEYAADLVQ